MINKAAVMKFTIRLTDVGVDYNKTTLNSDASNINIAKEIR